MNAVHKLCNKINMNQPNKNGCTVPQRVHNPAKWSSIENCKTNTLIHLRCTALKLDGVQRYRIFLQIATIEKSNRIRSVYECFSTEAISTICDVFCVCFVFIIFSNIQRIIIRHTNVHPDTIPEGELIWKHFC